MKRKPSWFFLLLSRHLTSVGARASVKWMNRFAFLAVALGVFAWVSVLSIMEGLQQDILRRSLVEKPHIFWEGKPEANSQELVEKIKEVLGSELISTQLILQTEAVLIPDRDPYGESRFNSAILLQGRDDAETYRLGEKLMSETGLTLGEGFGVRSAYDPKLSPLRAKVEGRFYTGVFDIDRLVVKVPRQDVLDWLDLAKGAASKIELFLRDPYRSKDLMSQIQKITDREFITWQEADAALWFSLKFEKWAMAIALSFVLLLSGFAIYFSVSVRVSERIREVALLRALGFPSKSIFRLFLTEGGVIALLGVGAGLLAAIFFCYLISNFVLLPAAYYSQVIPVAWNVPLIGAFLSLSVLVALLASWLPALRAKKVDIQQAMRA